MSEKHEMDLQKVKELIQLMIENDLLEVQVEEGKSKIHLKRPGPAVQNITQMPVAQVAPSPDAPAIPAAPADAQPTAKADDNLAEITSPIIGTYYAAPSPDSDPFLKVGDKVNPDTVVCIIEAMKVMNEIKAETVGTVVEILCQAGQAVEFGQPLFKVKPG